MPETQANGETDMTFGEPSAARRSAIRLTRRGAIALAGAAVLAGCDLGVNNPAVIGDEDLNDTRVIQSVVNGAISDVYLAVMGTNSGGGIFNGVALLTDEMVNSSNTEGFKSLSEGDPDEESNDASNRWGYVSRARWTTEDAIRRLTPMVEDPATSPAIGLVTLWAGFANRLIGDNYCEAVINGGGLEPSTVFLERAEGQFTSALDIATAIGDDSLRLAALAGRAQTRMQLGDWTGAVADAGQVPTTFDLPVYVSPGSARTRNTFAWQAHDGRWMTMWGTPFADWGLNESDTTSTGDPRVVYSTPRDTLDRYVTGPDDRRPFFQEQKYNISEDDTYLARGMEMRLIEAEAALRAGDVPTAIEKMNEARAHYNVINDEFEENRDDLPMIDPATVAGPDDAWLLLMKERGLTFYLEGRRLADLRRWEATPGVEVPFEVVRDEAVGQPYTADERLPVLDAELCFPISREERLSNPNVP